MKIHNTAVVDKNAKLADDVEVGPYCLIGAEVEIGSGTKIGSQCVIEGPCQIGKENVFYALSSIGGDPQDLKYKGEKTFLKIGDGNTIREFVTLNRGTGEGGETIIGNNNLLMAYAHVAHNCQVGNDCVMANGVTLAGHVDIYDHAILGGLVGIHQYCRVGEFAIIGGYSKLAQDAPPYSTCDGYPAKVRGINSIGLERAGKTKEVKDTQKKAYKALFFEGLNKTNALTKIKSELPDCAELAHLIEFVNSSKRGIGR